MSRWLPILLLVGCPKTTPDPAATPTPEPVVIEPSTEVESGVLGLDSPEHSAMTASRMHALLHLAETSRYHLTHGDLQGARMAAAALAVTPAPEGLPSVWRPFVADALLEAETLSQADSAEGAAAALARLGVSCGTCHVETGMVESVRAAVFPDDIRDEDSRMATHQWASDWMWFGLVTADERAYRLGAGVFLGENLPEPPEQVEGPELEGLLSRVGEAAAAAVEAQDDDERAARYGQLLSACSECHSTIRGSGQ